MKKYRVLNIISAIAIVAGLVLLVGTVGSMERDTITNGEGLVQIGISAAVLVGGLLTQAYLDKKYRTEEDDYE